MLFDGTAQIPATEIGLEFAKDLKQKHGLNSNMLFVSNPVQALVCASAGVASITMPVRAVSSRASIFLPVI